jgi:hypothetical protein
MYIIFNLRKMTIDHIIEGELSLELNKEAKVLHHQL